VYFVARSEKVHRKLGKLIAIEGCDGAGKGTLTAALSDHLQSAGREVATIDFPQYRNTFAGHALGRFLSGEGPKHDDPKVVATLYALDRFENITKLTEMLSKYDYVICDRYVCLLYTSDAADE